MTCTKTRRRRLAGIGISSGAALMATLALGATSASAAGVVDFTPPNLTYTGDEGVNDVQVYQAPVLPAPPPRPDIVVRDSSGIVGNCTGASGDPPRNQRCTGGTDTVTAVQVTLGGGDDVFAMNAGKRTNIDAGAGNDRLLGSSIGGGGSTGTPGDTIAGGDGSDSINGGADNDTINGGAGDDVIRAKGPLSGTDSVSCGPGSDTVYIDLKVDRLTDPENCESLNPTAEIIPNDALPPALSPGKAATVPRLPSGVRAPGTSSATACKHSIRGTDRNDLIRGTTAGGRLFGLRGNDRITGGAGDDCLIGGPGNDRLSGGSGRDGLSGGPGNDRLHGGRGTDRFLGGSGNDGITARDGERETVNCGSGRDTVTVDRADRVSRDCERVIRR